MKWLKRTFTGRLNRLSLLIVFFAAFLPQVFLSVLYAVLSLAAYILGFNDYSNDISTSANIGSLLSSIITIVLVIALLISLIFSILVILGATVRRLHDINYSGWWSLLCLIPYLNLVVYILLLLIPSVDNNSYGEKSSEVSLKKIFGFI